MKNAHKNAGDIYMNSMPFRTNESHVNVILYMQYYITVHIIRVTAHQTNGITIQVYYTLPSLNESINVPYYGYLVSYTYKYRYFHTFDIQMDDDYFIVYIRALNRG